MAKLKKLVQFAGNLMTTLPESFPSLTYHLQTGDDFVADQQIDLVLEDALRRPWDLEGHSRLNIFMAFSNSMYKNDFFIKILV